MVKRSRFFIGQLVVLSMGMKVSGQRAAARRRMHQPRTPQPVSIAAQVEGSGTSCGAKETPLNTSPPFPAADSSSVKVSPVPVVEVRESLMA
jgi:hypothetical protein